MRRSVVLLVALALLPFSQSADKPAEKPADPPAPAGFHRVTIGKHTFTLPKGFTIELVAESPQVDRPVTAAFDDKGRLYVADSSGSNAKPADQLKNPTHRVVMLESTKKDGKFDKSTVFADKLSFLQGTMWHDGSLYVATPPTIQKLTDTDGDGVADKREVWFDGGVLTGCANDVHGPYPGPDGRIYFTKGAFAKQEVKLGNGKKFVTRAAHIYSAKPDGSDIRVEMTGGMDNPVDVVFNGAGEMFFTTTFFQHPANGKRDGIVHATYGAVYGKDHDVVNDHPRARPELSEPMTHLGPAAPSGLHCYRGSAFGEDYASNLFACQFNLAKVSRHVLKPLGSTYRTEDSDFVVSDNRDFHPTDVIADADGSLLIVDTGGWYKLCCPSSVMEKKDVLGGIYRVRKEQSGTRVESMKKEKGKLRQFIDQPPHERRRTAAEFGRAGEAKAVPDLLAALADEKNDTVLDTALTRALIDIGDAKETRKGLDHKSPRVVRAALAALEQMPDGRLAVDDVVPHLMSTHPDLKATAWWVAGRHPDWADELAGVFARRLKETMTPEEMEEWAGRLARFASGEMVRKVIADAAGELPTYGVALRAMVLARPKVVPAEWADALTAAATFAPSSVVRAVRVLPWKDGVPKPLAGAVAKVAADENQPADARLMSLDLLGDLSGERFAFVRTHLSGDHPAALRGLAAEVLSKATLSPKQFATVAEAIPTASPLDFDKLLAAFAKSTDEAVGLALVKSLSEPKVRAAIRAEQVKPIIDKYPPAVQTEADKLYKLLEADRAEVTTKLNTLLKDTQPGDVRKGQAVFNSAKAACTACHKVAYVGGLIGPDLTKIGSIRSDRDLLEAVVFPSASFVRSYEPVRVDTKDGKSFNGILKADRPDEVVLTVSATEEVRIARKDIDEMKPGTVSVMPAGLDQQLTKQELADLVAFLKSLK